MKDGFVKVRAITPTVKLADCAENAKTALKAATDAQKEGVHLLVFPELFLTGASCGDLFFQAALQSAALEALRSLCENTRKIATCLVVGLPIFYRGQLFNTAAVLQKGSVLGIVPKSNITDSNEARQFGKAPKLLEYIRLEGFDYLIPFGLKLLFECERMQEFSFAVEVGALDLTQNYIGHCKAAAAIVANPYAEKEDVYNITKRRERVISLSGMCNMGIVSCGAGEGESTTDAVFSGHGMISENGELLAESLPFGGGVCTSEIDVFALFGARAREKSGSFESRGDYFITNFELSTGETTLTRSVPQLPFVSDDLQKRKTESEIALQIQTRGLKSRVLHIGAKAIHIGVSGGLDSALALMVCVRAAKELGLSPGAVQAVSMPCFGTSQRTRANAKKLSDALGVSFREIDITSAVETHFKDIGHSGRDFDAAFENAQARERTQVLMDLANMENGLVIGPGDLSELALGWTTYGGDHMSMYAVNASVPKTLVRTLLLYEAERLGGEVEEICKDILKTPVSPELLPAKDGEIAQKTEDVIGPYELHDFFIYYGIYLGFSPGKVQRLCNYAFKDIYPQEEIERVLRIFYKRFFGAQFKRSCLPDGPKVTPVSLSPRGEWAMPSDANATAWLEKIDR